MCWHTEIIPGRAVLTALRAVFIGPLAGRLAQVTGWLRAQPQAARRAVGYFGASTGAAAALWAAAEPGTGIAAVVSRGGRPDLARRPTATSTQLPHRESR